MIVEGPPPVIKTGAFRSVEDFISYISGSRVARFSLALFPLLKVFYLHMCSKSIYRAQYTSTLFLGISHNILLIIVILSRHKFFDNQNAPDKRFELK